MEYFCYHRDRHGAAPLRDRLTTGSYATIEVTRWDYGGRPE